MPMPTRSAVTFSTVTWLARLSRMPTPVCVSSGLKLLKPSAVSKAISDRATRATVRSEPFWKSMPAPATFEMRRSVSVTRLAPSDAAAVRPPDSEKPERTVSSAIAKRSRDASLP